MTIDLSLYFTGGQSFAEGAKLELLGDGSVLATGTTTAGGTVSFDADTSNVTKLAVRAVREPKSQSQAAS